MTVRQPKKLYEFHAANLQQVARAVDHVGRSARDAIARKDEASVATHVRLIYLLLGAWSEVRLLKLIYEPSAFQPCERERILGETALQRWLLAVEFAFRKHHAIPRARLGPPALDSTAHFRYQSLTGALHDELGGIVTMRNKLAHGQWAFPLNDSLDDVAQVQMNALRKENVLALFMKRKLLDSLCSAVHDLAVSRPTFERDWDRHFRRFEQLRVNIERKSYSAWAAHEQKKRVLGRKRLLERGNG